jgi:hypothetical protein
MIAIHLESLTCFDISHIIQSRQCFGVSVEIIGLDASCSDPSDESIA